MNKTTLILLGILAFWVAVLIAVFEFHIGIPVRAMFLMAFLCVAWLAYWTVSIIRTNLRADAENASVADKPTQPEKD